MNPASSLDDWIRELFRDPTLLRMGHAQRAEDGNLGLGWLYYALARLLRPRRAVVIGSYRGFVPLVLGRALSDNVEPGEVVFLDPSLADDFWSEPARVEAHFESHGVRNVRHHRTTTQGFVRSEAYRSLGEVGLLFVDGYHSKEQARFDYEAFAPLLAPRGVVFFHDSLVVRPDKVYGGAAAYVMGVKDFIDELARDPSLQTFDLPFGPTGLTMVRRRVWDPSRSPSDWIDGRP